MKRKRSETDRRVVYISLTEQGERAYYHHEQFYKQMIQAMMQDISEEEMKVLTKALNHLEIFFRNYQ